MSSDVSKSIELLCADIPRRFKAPTKSVTFYAYFLLAVVMGGGLGIWNALYQVKFLGWDPAMIASALYTYFPAVVAAALIDLIHEKQPYLRSFGLIAAGLFILIFFFATTSSPCVRLGWSILGALLGIGFWWFVNGEKDCFKDINPEFATPDPSLKMSGDVNGWKT